jgi:hypothetical protein
MVSGLKSKDYLERLEELKMPTLSQRRDEIDMAEMYKIMTGNTWFERVKRDGVLTRRAADPLNVKIPAARLDLKKNFFSVRVCKKWNNLPSEIQSRVTMLRASKPTTGDIREATRPKQQTDRDRMQENEWDETGRAIRTDGNHHKSIQASKAQLPQD